MNKFSIFKKIKLFSFYKEIIKENRSELSSKFNIRIDRAYRLYTVINIPKDSIGEEYTLKKSDIDKISESYIKSYSNDLMIFLTSKGLIELFDWYRLDKVSKYSYLLVFGFSLFKSHIYYNIIYYLIFPIIILSTILTYFIYISN